ncbi:hypothetical protein INT81_07895 [Riemerella anatipestifer]|nr:hypothetical protein [Riemerella anatipestifer]
MKKVKVTPPDSLVRRPDLYEGNPVFIGNVEFQHQGSVLKADKAVFYQNDNFVKAIGNVVSPLPKATALLPKKWNTIVKLKEVSQEKCGAYAPQQTIKTETLYYDHTNIILFGWNHL